MIPLNDPTLIKIIDGIAPEHREAVREALSHALSGGAVDDLLVRALDPVDPTPATMREFYLALARALTLAAERGVPRATIRASREPNPLAQPIVEAGTLTPDSPRGVHPDRGPVYHDGRAWRWAGPTGAVGALVPDELVRGIVLTAREALRVVTAERREAFMAPGATARPDGYDPRIAQDEAFQVRLEAREEVEPGTGDATQRRR